MTKIYKSLRDWVKGQLAEENFLIEDILREGCMPGFPGLTYYRETTALHDMYEGEIWDLVHDAAQEAGVDEGLAYITSMSSRFGYMGSMAQLKNALVWFAVEHICWELNQEKELRNTRSSDGDDEEARL